MVGMGAHSTYCHYNLSLSELFYLGKTKSVFLLFLLSGCCFFWVALGEWWWDGPCPSCRLFSTLLFYVIFFIKASRLPWWSNTTNVELWTYIERKKTEKENIKHKSLFYYFLSLLNCNWIERARVVQCGHDPNRWSWFSPVLVPHWNW
jgi:hypothetical protein